MNGDIMNNYVIIAGVNGTGKSSLRGVLEGQNVLLGHIIDANAIAKENNFDNIKAGKKAIEEINYCLENNLSFTQETTLAGYRTVRTIKQARKQGYYITMYYVGLSSMEERRISSLSRVIPLCDEVIFYYDNENGFIKVAEIKNNKFQYFNGYKPKWLVEYQNALKL